MLTRATLALVVLTFSIGVHVVRAQPRVRVRAEARIELRIERAPGAVTVSGTLRDDLGQPLPDRAIRVRADGGGDAITRTDADGGFSSSFQLATGTHPIRVRWEGDEGHRAVEIRQTIDLSRAHVRLDVSVADGRLDLDRPSHDVEVRASSEEGGAGLHVEVRNELERVLAEGTTDAEGRARFTIDSAALGPPAAGRLIVHSAGDARRAQAQTEVPVIRFRPISLTLRASRAHVRSGDPVVLSGELQDSAGPLARRAVGLFAGDRHLETVLTDDAGRFSRPVTLEASDAAPVVTARFASDAPWRPDARSEPIEIAIEGVGATPWSWLLAPMIACGLAVFALSRRRNARPPAASAPARRSAPPGIVPSRSSSGASARDVRGAVFDADRGTPIAGAQIVLRSEEAKVEAVSDAEGRFAARDLTDGKWTLEVCAPGFERSAAPVQIPHRGEWSEATVRLRSLREIALAGYRPLADALAPSHAWWAFWTPRELSERAPEQRGAIEGVTAEVERIVYAKPHPDEHDVAAVAERSAEIARRLD